MAEQAVHILWTEPLEEVHREELGPRWCFQCRKRVPFIYSVEAPVELSYYGPTRTIKCSRCGGIDTDVGFGREREWGE